MADDELTAVPGGTGAEAGAPEASPHTEPTIPQPTSFSRADVERLIAEQDAKWQTRLEELDRRAQSRTDKAKARADKAAQTFTKHAAVLGLSPEEAAEKARQVWTNEFQTDSPEDVPEPARPAPQNTYNPQTVIAGILGEAKKFGLHPSDPEIANVLAFADLPPTTSQEEFERRSVDFTRAISRAESAKAARLARAEADKRKEGEAAKVAAAVEGFGGTATLAGAGNPPSGEHKPKPTLEDAGDIELAIRRNIYHQQV